jgi:hypothetical protein
MSDKRAGLHGQPETPLRMQIEGIVAWAKAKTPCALHYQCLLATLNLPR